MIFKGKKLILPFLLLTSLGLDPSPARAKFVLWDGLNRGQVISANVSLAVVRIHRVHVNRTRKLQGYVQHRHLDLKVVKHLYGPRPKAASLTRLPYQPFHNSAWPVLGKGPVGKLLLMAWVRGRACGVGLGVTFGGRITLPILVSSVKDPRVQAILTFVHINGDRVPARRRKRVVKAFRRSKNRYLAVIADEALGRKNPAHRDSWRRFVRMLDIIDHRPNGDPEMGWPILSKLIKGQGARTLSKLNRWARTATGRTLKQRSLFVQGFRFLVQKRLSTIAAARGAEVNVRRWAVMGLVEPPSFSLRPLDAMDRAAIKLVMRQLKDPVKEVRRSTITALLTAARKIKGRASLDARKLVAAVQSAMQRERSPAERLIIRRRIQNIWIKPTP